MRVTEKSFATWTLVHKTQSPRWAWTTQAPFRHVSRRGIIQNGQSFCCKASGERRIV